MPSHHPNRSRMPLLWIAAAVLSLAAPAWAVVPGLAGPLQALAQLLPQILPFLAAGLAGLLSIPAWRARLGRFGRWLVTPRGLVFAGVALTGTAGLLLAQRSRDRSQIAIAAPQKPGSQPAWSMFRGNLGRTGTAPGAMGPATAPRVHWTFSDPEVRVADLSSSPAVVGDRIYLGSAQASVFDSTGMVYCLDARTGKRVWQFQTEKQVFSSPAVVGGRVYVGEGLHVDKGCKVYCLDAATGKKVWAATTKSHTESSPAVAGGKVYIGAGEDGIYCFDAATGKPLWHRAGMHVDTCPAVSEGKVFTGTGYGRLAGMALDAATGKTIWSTSCDVSVWGPAGVAGGKVYFGVGNGDFVNSVDNPRGGVWCLEAATGKQAWRTPLPDAVLTAILVQGGRVLAGCRDGKLYALDAVSGKLLWSAGCGGPVLSSPAGDGVRVYAAGSRGELLAFGAADGKPLWRVDLAALTDPGVELLSSPALAHGRLYLGTSKEKFFCIGP